MVSRYGWWPVNATTHGKDRVRLAHFGIVAPTSGDPAVRLVLVATSETFRRSRLIWTPMQIQ
jgi:hypothetical protein